MRRALVLLGILALVAVGCRSEEGGSEPASVSGFLVATGETVQLCEALAESFPPQCGGSATEVVGLEPAEVAGVMREGDTVWTDVPVNIVGDLDSGSLRVPPTPAGPTIFGRATTADGAPVAGALITVLGASGGESVVGITDATGRYVIVVPEGEYLVEPGAITDSAEPPAAVTVEVGGSPVTADFRYP